MVSSITLLLIGFAGIATCTPSCLLERGVGGIYWSSPGFASGRYYPNSAYCSIGVSTEAPRQALFTFNTFKLQGKVKTRRGKKCVDAVKFVLPNRRPVKFCGQRSGVYRVPNFRFENEFRSSKKMRAPGFNITVKAVETPCHRLIDLTSGNRTKGVIKTPGYPKRFPKSTQCEWWIRAPANRKIKLTIKRLTVKKSKKCRAAYAVVNTAGNQRYPAASSKLICGKVRRKKFVSKGNQINLIFDGGKVPRKGLYALYRII